MLSSQDNTFAEDAFPTPPHWQAVDEARAALHEELKRLKAVNDAQAEELLQGKRQCKDQADEIARLQERDRRHLEHQKATEAAYLKEKESSDALRAQCCRLQVEKNAETGQFAPITYDMLVDPSEKSLNIKALTSFRTKESLRLFIELLDANGLFSKIDPAQLPQEELARHVEYFNSETTALPIGQWMRVSKAYVAPVSIPAPSPGVSNPSAAAARAPVIQKMSVAAHDLVIILQDSRLDSHPPPGFIYVQNVVSRSAGFVPSEFLLPFHQWTVDDDERFGDDDDGVDGKKTRVSRRAMDWRTAVCFVLSVLCTGNDMTDCHFFWGIKYQTACRYYALAVLMLLII